MKNRRQVYLVYTVLSLLLLTGCSLMEKKDSDQEGVLPGKIWDSKQRRFLQFNEMLQQLAAADYVLLGEKHDNGAHHRHQADVITGLYSSGVYPQIVLEMLDRGDQEKIESFRASGGQDAEAFSQHTGFAAKGWDVGLYKPLLDSILTRGLYIKAGNLGRKLAADIVRQGMSSAPEEVRTWVEEFGGLDQDKRQALENEIRQTHCGKLPESLVPGMSDAQVARDITLSQTMLNAARPVVLIAGAGHVRKDRGIPWYLLRVEPRGRILTVGMIEVDGSLPPRERDELEQLYDFLWFTVAAEREDPCAGMARIDQ
jgi:uncharacterized iron-regulated protein